MGTTVWVDDQTRAALRDLQEALGTSSVNETIRRLLAQPAMDARSIFARYHREIQEILTRRRVRRLVAFGSRARGTAGPASDLDLAAEADPRADPLALLGVEDELETLLGISVQVVELPNARLARAIKKEGVPFAG